jgi:hypothetical protein
MKKIFLFATMISVILVFTLPEVLSPVLTYELKIETTFTDPYPVEPGKNLVLSISLLNNGSSDVTNVVIEPQPIEPFTLLESPKKEIGTIRIRKSIIVDYNLYVDSSAVSALHEIPVKVTYGVDKGFVRNVLVRVQGKPKFELLDVSSDTISPGDQEEIRVKIQNVGTGKTRRTSVTFSSTSDYIKPVLSGGITYLGDVNPGEEKEATFTLLASTDSEYGVYTGKINVTYDDESGNELKESFDVGILIGGEPKLQIYKVEADREESDLTVELVNIGNAEAKAIAAKLIINGKVFDADYVTSIKIDKRSTLKFTLPNSMSGKLELSYEGPDNKEYSQTDDVAWVIPFTFPTWIVIIVVLVVAYFVWKKKWWKKIF